MRRLLTHYFTAAHKKESGETLAEIGKHFGVSPQRAGQMVSFGRRLKDPEVFKEYNLREEKAEQNARIQRLCLQIQEEETAQRKMTAGVRRRRDVPTFQPLLDALFGL